MSAKLLQSCLTLCDPTDYSWVTSSSVYGILQARILEWVAMPSSRGSSHPRDWTHISYVSCIGRWVLYHQCHLGSSWGSPIGRKYFLDVLNFYSVNRVTPRQNDLMMQFTRKWTGSFWNKGKCFITSRELSLFFNKRIWRVIYFNLPDFTQVPHLRTL